MFLSKPSWRPVVGDISGGNQRGVYGIGRALEKGAGLGAHSIRSRQGGRNGIRIKAL
jgi:hypothetical protein